MAYVYFLLQYFATLFPRLSSALVSAKAVAGSWSKISFLHKYIPEMFYGNLNGRV